MVTVFALAGYLATVGCYAPCASGITANFYAESSLRPGMVAPSGVGLASWDGPRRDKLFSALGSNWIYPTEQMKFMIGELRDMHLLPRIWNARNPARAAYDFMKGFERPKACSRRWCPRSANPAYRMAVARAIYASLTRRR